MEQITLGAASLGATMKAQGLAAVEASHREFVQVMRALAQQISQARGSVTSDDLRVAAMEYGIQPAHPNAWGAVFQGPQWRLIGRQPSRLVTNHHREIKIWQFQDPPCC